MVIKELYAAQICDTLKTRGYDDWYLPARGELSVMQKQLGSAGSQDITSGSFWSSTESQARIAWMQYFSDSSPKFQYKNHGSQCLCVRRK